MVSIFSFGCELDLLASALTNIRKMKSEIGIKQIGSERREFAEKVPVE